MLRLVVHAWLALALALGVSAAQAKGLKTKSASGLVADFSLSRTTCVSPCAIFADTVGLAAQAGVTLPFHEIDYAWSGGDATLGEWSAGARATVNSRNAGKGPLWGVVYEAAGTKTVTLTQTYGAVGASRQRTVEVTSGDSAFPTTATICVSNDTDHTGCPAGATQHSNITSWATVCTYFGVDKRVLLHRDHIWDASATCNFSYNGGGTVGATIGAFGTGARPKIRRTAGFNTADVAVLTLSASNRPTMADLRVMDLEFDGSLATPPIFGHGINVNGGLTKLTLLRLHFNGLRMGILMSRELLDFWNDNGSPGHTIWDQVTIADCDNSNPPHGSVAAGTGSYPYGVFASGERFNFSGNNFDLAGDSVAGITHVARLTYLGKAVITNNTLSRPGPSQHTLKLHAPFWGGASNVAIAGIGQGYSRWITINDNKFTGSYTAWLVGIGPESGQNGGAFDASEDERVRDYIVDGNLFLAGGTGYQYGLLSWGYYGSIRNNVFDSTGATALHGGMLIDRRSTEQAAYPEHIYVYGNTCFSNDTDNDFSCIQVGAGTTNTYVFNNLGYAPNDTARVMVNGTPTASGNNTANGSSGNHTGTNPLFQVTPPVAFGDYQPQAGSYTKNAGTPKPVRKDALGTARSLTVPSIGAMEPQ